MLPSPSSSGSDKLGSSAKDKSGSSSGFHLGGLVPTLGLPGKRERKEGSKKDDPPSDRQKGKPSKRWGNTSSKKDLSPRKGSQSDASFSSGGHSPTPSHISQPSPKEGQEILSPRSHEGAKADPSKTNNYRKRGAKVSDVKQDFREERVLSRQLSAGLLQVKRESVKLSSDDPVRDRLMSLAFLFVEYKAMLAAEKEKNAGADQDKLLGLLEEEIEGRERLMAQARTNEERTVKQQGEIKDQETEFTQLKEEKASLNEACQLYEKQHRAIHNRAQALNVVSRWITYQLEKKRKVLGSIEKQLDYKLSLSYELILKQDILQPPYLFPRLRTREQIEEDKLNLGCPLPLKLFPWLAEYQYFQPCSDAVAKHLATRVSVKKLNLAGVAPNQSRGHSARKDETGKKIQTSPRASSTFSLVPKGWLSKKEKKKTDKKK